MLGIAALSSFSLEHNVPLCDCTMNSILPIDSEHLYSFWFLTIMNNAAMNNFVYISWCIWGFPSSASDW